MKKIPKKVEKGSEIAATLAVLLGTALFISELIFEFERWMHELIAGFEIVLCVIFFIEITIHLANAKSKRQYLKSNWFYILTITPFTRLFGLFGESARVAKAAHLLAHSNKAMEGIKEIKLLEIANKNRTLLFKEGGVALYHLNRCRFDDVPKSMHVAYVNTYISPHCNADIAKGILFGIKRYARKELRTTVIFRKKRWIDGFRAEQAASDGINDFISAEKLISNMQERQSRNWNVLITDAKLKSNFLQVFGKFLMRDKKGFGVFSTHSTEGFHLYDHIDSRLFRELKGMTLALHVMHQKRKLITPSELEVSTFRNYLINKNALLEQPGRIAIV